MTNTETTPRRLHRAMINPEAQSRMNAFLSIDSTHKIEQVGFSTSTRFVPMHQVLTPVGMNWKVCTDKRNNRMSFKTVDAARKFLLEYIKNER